MTDRYPFTLKPLPYAYDALEPYIDAETVQIHHDRHLQTYVDNLNKTLEPYPAFHDWTLHDLLTRLNELPPEIQTPVRNNAGGVYNHNLYFDLLSPDGGTPGPETLNSLNVTFGSYENFRDEMKKFALGQFGSGYAWLVADPAEQQPSERHRQLRLLSTANQDTPLSSGITPLLLVDVWEHAYYLKHQNKRGDYVDDWFQVVNWNQVEENYQRYLEENNL